MRAKWFISRTATVCVCRRPSPGHNSQWMLQTLQCATFSSVRTLRPPTYAAEQIKVAALVIRYGDNGLVLQLASAQTRYRYTAAARTMRRRRPRAQLTRSGWRFTTSLLLQLAADRTDIGLHLKPNHRAQNGKMIRSFMRFVRSSSECANYYWQWEDELSDFLLYLHKEIIYDWE